MENYDLKGIIPAVATAYDDNGKISEEKSAMLYTYLVDSGVSGLFVGGSTGEWPLLHAFERKLEANIAVSCARGKVPVIMHISSMLPSEIIDYAEWAAENGITAVSIVMPYYYKYEEDGLFRFFSSFLSQVKLPILLYNIPGNVRNKLTPKLLSGLVDAFPNVSGVKDSSMDFLCLQEFMQYDYSRSLAFYTGNDAQIIPACIYGANGAVSAAAGVFPRFVMRMYSAFLDGNLSLAKKMQQSLLRYRALVVSNPPMSVLKEALRIAGFDVNIPRAPLQSISKDGAIAVYRIIEEEELLS